MEREPRESSRENERERERPNRLLIIEAMRRGLASVAKLMANSLSYENLRHFRHKTTKAGGPCNVFINHRGVDTKRSVAGLIYDDLLRNGYQPFLDCKSMKPGDRLYDEIDGAIRDCKIGIALFSPRYCESYVCLHELALIMESKKKLIPIFWDVKPSQLYIRDNNSWPSNEVERVRNSLEEARYTVGLTFDSSNGDWPEFIRNATDAVKKKLMEAEEEAEDQKL